MTMSMYTIPATPEAERASPAFPRRYGDNAVGSTMGLPWRWYATYAVTLLRGLGRPLAQLLQGQPQPRDRRLEQPPVHIDEYALVHGEGQQAERRLDLVAGGFELLAPHEAGAALAALPALQLNGRLFVPAIGTAAPIGFLSTILAFGSHGLRICNVPHGRASGVTIV